MRILLLSDNFPPEGNAPATRSYEHAVRWVRAGHDVTVITCTPNFPEGRVFPGYRNTVRSVEQVDGIRVVRVMTYIAANEGFLHRTLDYASFMAAGFLAGSIEARPDVVVATSPQFFCALGGYALCVARRLPFVFELRDLWPASIVAVGAMQESLPIRTLERLELFLYRQADAVVAVTNSFRNDLVRRGISAAKIHVVINGVDLGRYGFQPRDAELSQQHDLEGRFVVGYLGTHGMAHALDKVLDAATRLQHRDDIVFLFAGGGASLSQLETIVQERRMKNVRLLRRQPKEMMPRLWSLCDVALVSLRNTPVFSTVIPSKIFESMGSGVPLLMSLPEGEATRIVVESGAGLCVRPESPDELARAIVSLEADSARLERYRQASRTAALRYSRDAQAQRMLEVLVRVANGSQGVKPLSQETMHHEAARHDAAFEVADG
jgi:colanic acid biosynthesis glycosyl transferase WcaI